MSKRLVLLLSIILVAALIPFHLATVGCATLDHNEVVSIHDRAILLYTEAVEFIKDFELTPEQKATVQNMIVRAEAIYKDIVALYGKSSDLAARWDILIETLKVIK